MQDDDDIIDGALSIHHSEGKHEIVLQFSGKSIVRDPTSLLHPTLLKAADEAAEKKKRMVLDFEELTYMNSSSFTPIIRILEKARLSGQAVSIVFDASKRWQSVSFAALTIFETADGRIKIRGA